MRDEKGVGQEREGPAGLAPARDAQKLHGVLLLLAPFAVYSILVNFFAGVIVHMVRALRDPHRDAGVWVFRSRRISEIRFYLIRYTALRLFFPCLPIVILGMLCLGQQLWHLVFWIAGGILAINTIVYLATQGPSLFAHQHCNGAREVWRNYDRFCDSEAVILASEGSDVLTLLIIEDLEAGHTFHVKDDGRIFTYSGRRDAPVEEFVY